MKLVKNKLNSNQTRIAEYYFQLVIISMMF